MLDLIDETFHAHGIYELDEEVFEGIVAECTKEYRSINREFREANGIRLVPRLRMRW